MANDEKTEKMMNKQTETKSRDDASSVDWLGLSFQQKVDYVRRNMKIGDVWIRDKSGKKCEVIWHKIRKVGLLHESGRKTQIQDHYFAGDYSPNV